MAERRKRKLERVVRLQPSKWLGDEIEVVPGRETVCAVCFWDHATIALNDNTYHKPCLDMLKREFHPVPAQLIEEGQA